MNKHQLREYLAKATAEYTRPVYTHAESVDQVKRLQTRCENRKKPVNMAQAEWDEYLAQVQQGTYKPVEDLNRDPLYDYEGL